MLIWLSLTDASQVWILVLQKKHESIKSCTSDYLRDEKGDQVAISEQLPYDINAVLFRLMTKIRYLVYGCV